MIVTTTTNNYYYDDDDYYYYYQQLLLRLRRLLLLLLRLLLLLLLVLLYLLSTIYLLLLLSLPTTISIDHANHDCDDGDDEDADDDEQEERARERERVREKSIPIDDDDNQKVDTLAQIWFKRRGASTCTLQHMPVSSSASHRTATQVGAAIHKQRQGQLPLPLHIVGHTDRQRTVDSGPERDNNKQRLANHPANRRLRGRSCGTARVAVLSTAAPTLSTSATITRGSSRMCTVP